MLLPNKLVAVAIDKDRGSQIALKWTVEHLLARDQTVLLIHVKLKQFANASGQSPQTKSNQNVDESGSGNVEMGLQTKELFLPFRVFCTRKDIQCYNVVLDDTDVSKAIVGYVNRTGVEILILGATTRGGLLRFKAKDISGGGLKGAPDFCTVHIISKSGKISSTRAASRPAPFVHPLRHQLMQPASTKYSSSEPLTPSAANSRSEPTTRKGTGLANEEIQTRNKEPTLNDVMNMLISSNKRLDVLENIRVGASFRSKESPSCEPQGFGFEDESFSRKVE